MDNYYDLGTHTRRVSTQSSEAQLWCNRGLMWLYGYNFGEAVNCFEKAAAADPACIFALWGIAYGLGCIYNKPWRVFSPREIDKVMDRAHAVIAQGKAHLDQATAVEGALLLALEKRFQQKGVHEEETLTAWNNDFANAMREVYRLSPDDWDIATLFAEALINRTPWQLWNLATGQPADDADTVEAIDVLERGLAQVTATGAPPHPGLHHIYIHVMEMSPHPEKALRSADVLRELVPEAVIYAICRPTSTFCAVTTMRRSWPTSGPTRSTTSFWNGRGR